MLTILFNFIFNFVDKKEFYAGKTTYLMRKHNRLSVCIVLEF